MSTIRCPGCAAVVPDVDGPTHRYIGGAPACWAAFTELLVQGIAPYGGDAYAAQHPGSPVRRPDGPWPSTS